MYRIQLRPCVLLYPLHSMVRYYGNRPRLRSLDYST